jgi:hypothetical protein
MSRRACTFKQRDVDAAGVKVARVEVDASGKLSVITHKMELVEPNLNEWDEVLNGKH